VVALIITEVAEAAEVAVASRFAAAVAYYANFRNCTGFVGQRILPLQCRLIQLP